MTRHFTLWFHPQAVNVPLEALLGGFPTLGWCPPQNSCLNEMFHKWVWETHHIWKAYILTPAFEAYLFFLFSFIFVLHPPPRHLLPHVYMSPGQKRTSSLQYKVTRCQPWHPRSELSTPTPNPQLPLLFNSHLLTSNLYISRGGLCSHTVL